LSLLTIIQDAAVDLNLSSPSAVAASTDTQVQQLFSLLKRDGLDLVRRFDWQSLIVETSFSTVATQQQTTLATVAPDFFRMVDETMNNRTQHWRVLGPLSPQEWQRRLSLGAQVGVVNSFRIYGDAIYFYPVPPADNSVYFEYITNKWVQDSGGTPKVAFTADTDTARINEDVLTLGVKWRFLKAKGLDYSEEFRSYESALESIFGSDGARGPVDMTGSTIDWTIPALPDGSWNI
jgi:hypothetical protein